MKKKNFHPDQDHHPERISLAHRYLLPLLESQCRFRFPRLGLRTCAFVTAIIVFIISAEYSLAMPLVGHLDVGFEVDFYTEKTLAI